MGPDRPLYHWSPRAARSSILRLGLVPGRRSPAPVFDVAGEWRAPYVCLALDPDHGAELSWRRCGVPGDTWDLWQVYLIPSDRARGRRDGGRALIEVRVWNRVPKSRVAWLGERVLVDVRGRPR